MARHTPLSESEIAELRAISTRGLAGAVEPAEHLRYVPRLIIDLVALRSQLRRDHERLLADLERLADLLARTRPHLAGIRREDEDFRALLLEIDEALSRRRF